MERFGQFSPEEYIKEKADVLDDDRLNRYRLDENQYFPYVDAVQSGHNLEQNFGSPECLNGKRGDLRLTMSTEPLREDEEKYISRRFRLEERQAAINKWGVLGDLILAKGNLRDRDGVRKLRISAEVGDRCRIVINRSAMYHQSSSDSFTPGRNIIVLNGDPIYPANLFTLMHEIGHFKAWEKMGHSQRKEHLGHVKKFRQDVSSMSFLLSEERNAWAYALDKLRPFLAKSENDLDKGFISTRQFCLDYIHQVCLRTYGEAGLKLLEQIQGDFNNEQ